MQSKDSGESEIKDIHGWVKANLVRPDGRMIQSKARKVYWESRKDAYRKLKEATDFLPKDASLVERVLSVVSGTRTRPKCPVCNKGHLKFRIRGGYTKTCSAECARSLIGVLSREGSMNKLGVKNPALLESTKKKISAALKRHYSGRKKVARKMVRRAIKH